MINFDNLVIGKKYDRPQLAEIWGYKSYNAISRGVITPKDKNFIILFITKEKQVSLTQYEDHIDSDILFWEGEKEHGSDDRIISKKDVVYVFYREKHHSAFTYKGRALLRSFRLSRDRPSKFVFSLIDLAISEKTIVADINSDYGIPLTEKEAIVNSRVGQGLFRNRSIELWKSCSVTEFSKQNILIASHIKPWKLSSNQERINPYNSLLLIPTLDKLFDKGYITFNPRGNIILSEKIDSIDWVKINVDDNLKLKFIPDDTVKYLEYHNEYIFDLNTL
jgi:hypothetical protein